MAAKRRHPVGPAGRASPSVDQALRGLLVLLDWQGQIVRAALEQLEGAADDASPRAPGASRRPPRRT